MSVNSGKPSWVISITVRSIKPLIEFVFEVQINKLQLQMILDDVVVSSSEYGTSTSFQLRQWPIAWFILALNIATSSHPYGLLKTWQDHIKVGVGNCQLFKNDFIIPPFQECEINHYEWHCRLISLNVRTFIYICDLHDCCCFSNRPQAGHIPNWARNNCTALLWLQV